MGPRLQRVLGNGVCLWKGEKGEEGEVRDHDREEHFGKRFVFTGNPCQFFTSLAL